MLAARSSRVSVVIGLLVLLPLVACKSATGAPGSTATPAASVRAPRSSPPGVTGSGAPAASGPATSSPVAGAPAASTQGAPAPASGAAPAAMVAPGGTTSAPVGATAPAVLASAGPTPVSPAAASAATTTLDLDVEAPSWTSGPVFVTLDQDQGGNVAWSPDEVALSRDAQGRWRGQLTVTAGATVQWKVTRGGWDTVEKGPHGQELANRTTTAGAAGTTRVYAHVFHWGDDRILPPAGWLDDLGDFVPRKLGTPRKVVSHLPRGYDDPANAGVRYPVLYALDGQNLFDPSRAFGGVAWGMDGAAEGNAQAGRGAFIVVAIDNTSARIDEYTPSFDGSVGQGGRLEDFADFLLNELKPTIDGLYRTSSGPDDTGVIGSSLGGLAAIHLGWKHSDQLRRIGAVSPSLWWNNEESKAMVSSASSKPALRIWLDIGTNEGSDPQATVDQTRAFGNELLGKGFVVDQDLKYTEVQGGEHNEGWWAKRLPDVLGFLFP